MRHHGEGTFYKEGKYNCWKLQTKHGTVVRKAKTLAELKEKRKVVLKELEERGRLLPKAEQKQTLAGFLDSWLINFIKPSKAYKTHRQYEQVVRNYITPAIGNEKLNLVTAMQVQAMLNGLGKRGLSSRTVDLTRTVLRKALNDARKQQLILNNPVEATEKPKAGPLKKRALNDEEIVALTQELLRYEELKTRPGEWRAVHRYGPMIGFLLSTGLRISEGMAVRWQDVLQAGSFCNVKAIRIEWGLEWRQPERVNGKRPEGVSSTWSFVGVKTQRSRRVVPLIPQAEQMLERQREIQKADSERAAGYREDHDLIFTTETGAPVIERNIQRALDIALENIGLGHFSLHDLRRSFGTQLARNKVPVHILQSLMGHESSTTTMKHYVTSFAGDMADAVTVMGGLVASAPPALPTRAA
jgi:integrase